MLDEERDLPGGTRAVEIGKRLPFFRRYTNWGEPLFQLLSPLLLVWVAYWIVGLVRGRAYVFDDDHFGRTVVVSLFFAVVAVVGLFGIWTFRLVLHEAAVESACPCCGARRRRIFDDPSEKLFIPTACGECLAYLRATGVEVAEESIDSVYLTGPPFEVPPERYVPVVKRDSRGNFSFKLPAICTICGSPDAPYRRNIKEWGTSHAVSGSITGEIYDNLSLEIYGADWRPDYGSVTNKDSKDEGVRRMRLPICAEHKDEFSDPVEYKNGSLLFASYRYYLHFCALNQIRMVKAR
jgi:hypothetical protein